MATLKTKGNKCRSTTDEMLHTLFTVCQTASGVSHPRDVIHQLFLVGFPAQSAKLAVIKHL